MHLHLCCYNNKMASVALPHCVDSSGIDQWNVKSGVTWSDNSASQNNYADRGVQKCHIAVQHITFYIYTLELVYLILIRIELVCVIIYTILLQNSKRLSLCWTTITNNVSTPQNWIELIQWCVMCHKIWEEFESKQKVCECFFIIFLYLFLNNITLFKNLMLIFQLQHMTEAVGLHSSSKIHMQDSYWCFQGFISSAAVAPFFWT